MIYFQNFTGIFVAKGYSIGATDLIQISYNLFQIKVFQYSSAVDISDKLKVYDYNHDYIGTYLVRKLPDPLYNKDMEIWQANNTTLERLI